MRTDHRPSTLGRWCRTLTAVLALSLPMFARDAAAEGEAQARVLVVALDGVSLRVAERVAGEEAYAAWSKPVAMVAPFPSMTNVAFANMLGTVCTELLSGYEVRYFEFAEASPETEDAPAGRGRLRYRYSPYEWRDLFDVISHKLGSKAALYATPRKKAKRTIKKIEKLVLESPHDVMLTHLASTDYIAHVSGDEPVVELMLEVGTRLESLAARHLEKFGRPLRVVMLSDHGNTNRKTSYTKGLRDALRDSGFRVTKKLRGPDDLVAPTYGAVNYGALYVLPGQAERAAEAALVDESVDLAIWSSGEAAAAVASKDGRASIRWRPGASGRDFAYLAEEGDPLRLQEVVASLRSAGKLDDGGYAGEDDWLEASLDAEYPDAPRRLAESLDGTLVENSAVVILSLSPDFAWGHGFVRFSARLSTGRLEAVHGGLDRESTLGFYMTNDVDSEHNRAIRSDRVFSDLEADGECFAIRRDE